jgi:hypothetical protein
LFRHKPKLHDLALLCQSFHAPKPIASNNLKEALSTSKIVVKSVSDAEEVIQPEEIELFKQKAWGY